ncbi:GH25 family lysozyme M1 (1,4-beta-N-acetylmuramidase) [Actinokineospora baliensis]|uniref:GH25 family lysozyme n=1 Tax=Actinokineospora baliensis TaxID=547056 RepID=UPI001958DF64|nr:GH25 family lysozyme [Actinokineospora baliensis]MBM7771718.1 GH25 family lysozyme M1 (1,4-beta-N-acetylmuramidase) [Actinokineospora baliensis]
MTDYGIDVSRYNTVNDWRAVRGNNITYASVKLTESTDWVDASGPSHVAGARSAGIAVGGYHFARATNVQDQVDHFTAHLRRHGLLAAGSLAPMLDMEAAELRSNANAFVADFITRLRATAGIRRVLVYANLDWYRNVLRADWADGDTMLWIARYNGDPGNPGWNHHRLALHQHTSTGRVPGIPGPVDRDATIGPWTLGALTLDGAIPPPAPTPAPSPPAGRTHPVAPGETLSEIAARYGTTVAALAALNGISNPNHILAGSTLRLPDTSSPAPAPARRHRIAPGETLSEIAARFRVSQSALARANGIANPDKIRAGDWLTIP